MAKPDTKYVTKNSETDERGLDCPLCGSKIAITLQDLLSRSVFRCSNPQCKSVIRLDRGSSKEALDKAKEFQLKIDQAMGNSQ